jgi:hypothetical protein
MKPTNAENTPFGYEAFVHVTPATVPVGGAFTIRCEARGGADASNIYNPFLSERYRLSARITIVSADGKIRHDVLRPPKGSLDKSDFRCWPPLGGRTVGREFMIKLAKSMDHTIDDARVRAVELPPGEYYVQAIYDHWLISSWLNRPSYAGPRPTNGTGDEPRPIRGYSNAQMDDLLHQATVETNFPARVALYTQIQELWTEMTPTVPLVQKLNYVVLNNDVSFAFSIASLCDLRFESLAKQ